MCVDLKAPNVQLLVSKAFASHWGAKGGSVRRELEDTLRAHFGDRVTTLK